jgi:hypothetical protein
MPSKVFLRGDSDAIWLAAAADEVLSAVEQAEGDGVRFLRLDMTPYARGEHPRPAYFDPGMVAAILPMDPREYEHLLDDPPEWLR